MRSYRLEARQAAIPAPRTYRGQAWECPQSIPETNLAFPSRGTRVLGWGETGRAGYKSQLCAPGHRATRSRKGSAAAQAINSAEPSQPHGSTRRANYERRKSWGEESRHGIQVYYQHNLGKDNQAGFVRGSPGSEQCWAGRNTRPALLTLLSQTERRRQISK